MDSEKSNIIVSSGNTTTTPTTVVLRAGDVDNNNAINIQDVAIITSAFGTNCNDNNLVPLADLNNDCFVNIQDVSLVSSNFGLLYPGPWPSGIMHLIELLNDAFVNKQIDEQLYNTLHMKCIEIQETFNQDKVEQTQELLSILQELVTYHTEETKRITPNLSVKIQENIFFLQEQLKIKDDYQ